MEVVKFDKSYINEIVKKEISPEILDIVSEFVKTSKLEINERNVKDVLVASKLLILDVVYDECCKFIKENINVNNSLSYYEFATSKNIIELQEYCLKFILYNFTFVRNSKDFNLMSHNQLMKLIQSDDLNEREEKIYESVILWVKYDINNRCPFLPGLMTYIRMSLISYPYFVKHVFNEIILKLTCPNLLLGGALEINHLKKSGKKNIVTFIYNNKMRKYYNQLIIIYTMNVNSGECSLESITNGDKLVQMKQFTSYNSSIILSDGRIVSINRGLIKKNWFINIYDGKNNRWDFVCYLTLSEHDKNKLLNLIELDKCVYMMAPSGCFMCFNVETKDVSELKGIDVKYYRFNGLTTVNGFIYMIGETSVLRYYSSFQKWLVISKFSYPRNCPIICSKQLCLYVMGGKKNNKRLKSAVRYDISSDTWKNIADMNVARFNAGATIINGNMYVFGGENCDSYESYDPINDKWTLSKNKLKSKEHNLTRAFTLDPEADVSLNNISQYYSTRKYFNISI